MRDPFFLMCGVLCIYPLIFFALPAFIVGRYRPRFRSPIALDQQPRSSAVKAQHQAVIRQIVKKEDVAGYGPAKQTPNS